jgi:hypothetical protein
MRVVVQQPPLAASRLPIIEPVSPLPGLPAMPGEVRRPVPSIAGIHHQPASR